MSFLCHIIDNFACFLDGLLGIALVGGTAAVVASAAAVIFGFALAKATR